MIRALIIEDEPLAAQRLEAMLMQLKPDIRIQGTIDSVAGAIEWFRQHQAPDLIFLDIQLGDGISFDIFRQVQPESFIIFTTAYDEYALRAFELNSIEYLLKPIQPQRLEAALAKFDKIRKPGTINFDLLLEQMQLRQRAYKERFLVNVGDKIKSIGIDQASYFYALEKNVFMCTSDGMSYPLDLSLDQLENVLNPRQFFRINRQYIIAFGAIGRLHLMPKSRIAISLQPPTPELQWVSSARTAEFRKWLDM
ncbi:MAG: response regulator transcription factor [Bacteroidetes bacterium]|nr:response regulator transcription factor [Bacteroidota bacterium]